MTTYYLVATTRGADVDVEYALSQTNSLLDIGTPTPYPFWETMPDGTPIVGGKTYSVFWRYLSLDWELDQVEHVVVAPDPAPQLPLIARLTADFVQPAVGNDAVIAVTGNESFAVNDTVAIGPSYYRVSVVDPGFPTAIRIENLGVPGSVPVGQTVTAPAKIILTGPPKAPKGGLIQGTTIRTDVERMPDPDAVFGEGPYSFFNRNPANYPDAERMVRGVLSRYYPQLPDESWWYVRRSVHDNAGPESGFWASEEWEPQFSVHQPLSKKRWYYQQTGWSAFFAVWGANNFTPPPAAPVHVQQVWNDPVNQKGDKPLIKLPLSTSGTYDSVTIEGVMGPWEAEHKTYIRLWASNRNGLEVSHQLWGANRDFAIRARRLTDGAVEFWAFSPTGVSQTNLVITTQQGVFFSEFDVAPVLDIFSDGDPMVFDSLDTITYPPDSWIRQNGAGVEFRQHPMVTQRYYGLGVRSALNEALAQRRLLPSVLDPVTKEYVSIRPDQWTILLSPPTPTPPVAPSVADQTTIVGTSFVLNIPSFTLTAGRTLSSSRASGLPAGLTYNSATRQVTGSATGAGSFRASITDTDSAGESATVFFTITVNPAAPTVFALASPLYNCQTGEITFRTTGGNGSAIEYQANGVTDWSSSPNHTVEPGPRGDAEFLFLKARQNGVVVTRDFPIRAYCSTNPDPGTGGGGGSNSIPVLSIQPPNQRFKAGEPFRFYLPLNTFIDADNDPLTYSSSGAGVAYDWYTMVQGVAYSGSGQTGAPGLYYSGIAPAGVAQTVTEGVIVTDSVGGNNFTSFQIEIYVEAPTGPRLSAAQGRFYLEENFHLDSSIQVNFADLPSGSTPQMGIQSVDSEGVPGQIFWFNFDPVSGSGAGSGMVFTPSAWQFTKYYRWGSRSTVATDIKALNYYARTGPADSSPVLLYNRDATSSSDTGVIALNTAPDDATASDETTNTYDS